MNMRGRLAPLWLSTVMGLAACSGGGGAGPPNKPDAAVEDTASPTDRPPGSDTTAPGEDAAAGDDAIVCAPLPGGGPVPAGTAPAQPAGPAVASTPTRPQVAQDVADAQYTIQKALAHGGFILQPGGGLAPADGGIVSSSLVTYSVNDNWDPVANGIGDPATFTPMFTVSPDGSGGYPTINAAVIAAGSLAGCARVYIRLMPGTYRQQVVVPSKTSAPPLTLYGVDPDASKTTIVFDASYPSVGNMSSSATVTIKALSGFQMKNITIANDYVEGSLPGNDQSAVVLLNQCDRSQFENVRILGNIAPLYLKSVDVNTAARSYFRDSYVEGDQDIILGRGIAVFDHTEIKYLSTRQPAGGIIASPSTLVYNHYGFLFDSCQFTAGAGATGVFLAHQWMEGGNAAAVGKMIVRNSTLGSHIAAPAPWSAASARMTTPKDPAGTTPVIVYTSSDYFAADAAPTPPEPFIAEYGNAGPGATSP